MTFPTTGLLDDFNRSNSDPMDGSWTNNISGYGNQKIVSNQVQCAASGVCSSGYNAATYGPDCECYATMVNWNGGSQYCYIRLDSLTDVVDGYNLRTNLAGSSIRIYRTDNSVQTQLGADVAVTWTNGDKAGIECIGSTIKGYQYTSGAWTEKISRSDATYGSTGYLGMVQNNTGTSPIMDDFSGGTVVSGARLAAVRALLGVGL